MNRPTQVIAALSGIALTAAGAYLFDPDSGKRRRSELGDRCKRAAKRINDQAHTLGDGISHQYKDVSSRARSWFSSEERKDKALARRVRIDLWRAVPDTQKVGATAHEGEIILHGDVLAKEHQHVLDVVRSVEGVRNVADHLTERADIPKPAGRARLQQGYVTVRNNLMQEKWTPPTRVCSSALGLGLMGWGVQHRNAVGIAGALAGAALVLRSASNVPFSRFARRGRTTAESGLRKVTQEVEDATQSVKDAASLGNAGGASRRSRATAAS